MRWFFLLCISIRLFASPFDEVVPSTPEEILSLTGNLLVEGFVSVTSGQIALSEIDLSIKGAQGLVLKRTYIPPQILGRYEDKDEMDRLALGKALCQLETKGWVVHPHLWAGYNRNSNYFQIRDPSGFTLEFDVRGNRGVLKASSYGCSNLRGDEPSSGADIRNIELWVEGDQIKVIWPDGIQRQYLKQYPGVYRLERELLANGKIIRYEYNNQQLSKISSSDPTGQFTYSSITRVNGHHYLSSDGQEVDLVYEKQEIKGKYKKDRYCEKVASQFSVMTQASNPRYTNTVGYNERTLLNAYDSKAYPISCTYFQIKNVPARIQTFSTPAGSVSFSYDSAVAGQKGGSTTVFYPDGVKVIYRFNKILLLEAIENWFEENLINKKIFSYDEKQHIKSIETLDGAGTLLIAKRFECDHAGNPILEKTEGDFGVFCIHRKFDKNRLVREMRDDGLQYEFTYLGDTWLVTAKTTFDAGMQLRKTIYFYDDANNLSREEEEGKTRTNYVLYQTAPHLHRVEWEEKIDWDGQLIYQIYYQYDQWGNTAEERYFGSDGKLAYVIERTYNEKGELLNETNPLGEMAKYKYDERGRCFHEEPFSNGLVLTRAFDAKGRLRALTENDHTTKFVYNASDELIEQVNYLGVITKYHYDPVHSKPDRVEEGLAVTEIVYDAFGRERERIDPYQATTTKSYNAYGDITNITYPDGGEETFDYFSNGLVKSHRDPDGLLTVYTYDALGRIKEKTVGAYTTTNHYNGYNLYQTIDPAGFISEYKYDLLGRKIEEKRQGRITRYGYDSLGFLAWEERGNRRIESTHDCLGQLRKKSIDDVLNTLWTYDRAGNISTIEQGGLSTRKYDAHNRLIEQIDPEGNKTIIRYEKGPQVLLKKMTDPMGVETIETYNAKGQLLEKRISGQIVERFEYDLLFRLQTQDHLTFGYTPNGKKQWIREAGQRTTDWSYTPGDRLSIKHNPDGAALLYEYDSQLRLKKVGTREYRYDQLDRIIGGSGFSRTLDAFGNIIREEWSNGLWIESEYDDWDRPILRKLPDQSRIEYIYERPFLKKVTRVSQDGSETYSHTYDHHDPRGNPQLEIGFFETAYAYDRLGRRIRQQDPYFSETIDYNPSGNLIRKGNIIYAYDDQSQMTIESGHFHAQYDTHYNLNEFNGKVLHVDELNQIADLTYDLNGNLLKPGFMYDEFNQLVEAQGVRFLYDALGRRMQAGARSFLYIGDEEIGAFENNEAKELKVMGLAPIAIEIQGKPYASIVDVQGTIRLLIDPISAQIAQRNDCDTFGAGLTDSIPYGYSSKRYDANTGLIYFGQRFYDPTLRRWLTPDPLGPVDHSNLYQYLLNSPFSYRDPTGESIGEYLLGLGEIALGGALIITGGALQFASLGAWTIGFGVQVGTGMALIGHGLALTTTSAQDISFQKRSSAPQPQLPSFRGPNNTGQGAGGNLPGGWLTPIGGALGAHTVFKKNRNGKVTKYETYQPQTNPRDPKPWESVKRYDAPETPHEHYNKITMEDISTPHVHDRSCPGGVRPPQLWEIPP